MKRNLFTSLILLIFALSTMSFYMQDQPSSTSRVVPDEYKNKVNPFKGDETLKMVGLRNFNRHCVSCHGKTGIGDGIMAKNLKVPPGDLTRADFQHYTDGEIYYLSFVGLNDRPDFMKLIPSEEDKWAIVNYVRTLKAE